MIRLILIIIIIFLVVRIFVIMGSSKIDKNSSGNTPGDKESKKKGVPRELGEYVEFEEVRDKR